MAWTRQPRLRTAYGIHNRHVARLGSGVFRRLVELRIGGHRAAIARQPNSSTPESDPLALAVALVGWANDRGGKDNISVTLARL